uniref:Kinesin family member 27 n=1 Tax=Oryzias melastigma TaxID=30732 RepID=A0A3B3E1H5_ORYME
MTEECVCVAVRVRPLLAREVLNRHQVCVRVVPGSAQVMLGSDRLFSFDHAFGPTSSQDEVFESCVQPLVESCVQGFNATVFCYGQTGSGKTFTLGGGQQGEPYEDGGIVDRVVQEVFRLLQEKKKNNEGLDTRVRVSYVELYREELRDLLELQNIHKELHIREDERGNTVVVGVKEMVVTSTEELLSIVETGNALRHTGPTAMNEHSSRSHTILTLHIDICCRGSSTPPTNYSQSSKLRLVDLAGSERSGKTGNTGTRLKETAHINTGLLALGNVIRALTDSRRGNSCTNTYIPYRDAKITRLLRDSLGGTAHTLMVACVSPSHHYVAETLNVLQFASKARHIRNCPGATTPQSESKFCHTAWHPDEQKTQDKEKNNFKESSQTQIPEPDNPDESTTYYLLAREAADMLPELYSISLSLSFRQRLQDWQERFKAASQQCQTDDGDRPLRAKEEKAEEEQTEQPHKNMIKLRKELYKYKVITVNFKVVVPSKPAKNFISGAPAEEQSPASSAKRPHSVPLVRHSCFYRPPRKIHSSPPTYSLERVMAAFKMRGQLLLAEVEERDEVYCPFVKQQAGGRGGDEERKEEEEEEDNGSLTGEFIKSNTRNARRAGATERRIHDLSVSMRMKEELIRELQKTGVLKLSQVMNFHILCTSKCAEKGALAARRHVQHSGEGREVDVLARLSMQNQQVCSEVYQSLQHMRLQRAQLQSSLRETSNRNKEVQQNGVSRANCKKHFISVQRKDRGWLEEEEEQVLQKRVEMQELEEELRRREEVLQHFYLSWNVYTIEELVKERDMLKKKRDVLDAQLRDNRGLSVEEEYSLLQLEEAIEALDAALEFKNKSIQSRRDHLPQSSEPAQLCSVVRKLKKLSAAEAVELLILYFHKVVSLREAERRLRLRCEELELHAGEQEVALRQKEAGIQRLVLDAERRLTEQQKEHQSNLQELLQKLNECSRGETPQATQDRLQFLEKELFFYKSSSRQLKKKLKEFFVDGQAANTQPSSSQEHRKIQLTQMQKNDLKPNYLDKVQSGAHVTTTHTKINSDSGMHRGSDPNRSAHQAEVYTKTPFSSSDCKDLPKPKTTDQIPTGSKVSSAKGQSDETSKLTPVRLCRRELRQICTADSRLSGAATRGNQSVSSSTESMLEDSIEMLRKTHR